MPVWKLLIYNHKQYANFTISIHGEIKNTKTNHIYKIQYNKKGYAIVTLPMGKRENVKSIRLHKALAETFIPNPNKYNIVHHKDNNPSNFDLSNLEWVSNKINISYSLQDREKQTPYFNNRKLTAQNVADIRQNEQHLSYQQLANRYHVSKTTINNVINNKYYIGQSPRG